MIILNFRKWSSKSGRFFVIERLYKFGEWSPLCRVSLRYYKTMSEMRNSSLEDEEIYECS